MLSYYDLLGVAWDATPHQVYTAYRGLRDHAGSTERERALDRAWWVLGEPERRSVYDGRLRTWLAAHPDATTGGTPRPSQGGDDPASRPGTTSRSEPPGARPATEAEGAPRSWEPGLATVPSSYRPGGQPATGPGRPQPARQTGVSPGGGPVRAPRSEESDLDPATGRPRPTGTGGVPTRGGAASRTAAARIPTTSPTGQYPVPAGTVVPTRARPTGPRPSPGGAPASTPSVRPPGPATGPMRVPTWADDPTTASPAGQRSRPRPTTPAPVTSPQQVTGPQLPTGANAQQAPATRQQHAPAPQLPTGANAQQAPGPQLVAGVNAQQVSGTGADPMAGQAPVRGDEPVTGRPAADRAVPNGLAVPPDTVSEQGSTGAVETGPDHITGTPPAPHSTSTWPEHPAHPGPARRMAERAWDDPLTGGPSIHPPLAERAQDTPPGRPATARPVARETAPPREGDSSERIDWESSPYGWRQPASASGSSSRHGTSAPPVPLRTPPGPVPAAVTPEPAAVVSDDPAEIEARRRAVVRRNDVCEQCDAEPARRVRVRWQGGMLLRWQGERRDESLCRTCGIATFRRITDRALLLGWWGIVSFFTNLWVIPANLVQRARLGRLRPPQGARRTPLDPGRPVWLRPGIIVPLVMVLVLGTTVFVLLSRPSGRPGECVTGSDEGVRYVRCDQPNSGSITAEAATADGCPAGTDVFVEERRGGQVVRVLCVVSDRPGDLSQLPDP